MYGTNGLTLNGLYPYGEQHGDTTRTGYDLSTATLLQPIYNLIGLGSHGLTATKIISSQLLVHVCQDYSKGDVTILICVL